MAQGLKGLDKMMRTLDATKKKTAKKCDIAGVRAGLTPLAKAIRAGINATSASKGLKRAARKTIGKSLKRYRGGRGAKAAKTGFAVGKPSKKKRDDTAARSSDKSAGGVGVSASNIHWFVLGTKERRQKKSGKATGKIAGVFSGVVPRAAMSARGAMLEAMRKKVKQVLARETAKLAK